MSRASDINHPSHWRQRAQRMRELAAEAKDAEAKVKMLRVAEECDRLAELGEQRTSGNDGV